MGPGALLLLFLAPILANAKAVHLGTAPSHINALDSKAKPSNSSRIESPSSSGPSISTPLSSSLSTASSSSISSSSSIPSSLRRSSSRPPIPLNTAPINAAPIRIKGGSSKNAQILTGPSEVSTFAGPTSDVAPPQKIAIPHPISSGPDGPIYAANATLPPDYATGVLSLSYGKGNCTMSPGFDGYDAKSCSCLNTFGKWYNDYATATTTFQQCRSSYDPGYAISVQPLGCSSVTSTLLARNYTAPTDCCDKCNIEAQAVRLIYWPPAGATNSSGPAVAGGNKKRAPGNATITAAPMAESYGIVTDGFTFISPSVYVVYTSILASASCVANVASYIPIGTVHTLVTRAYAPEAISSAICVAQNVGEGIAYCVQPVGGPVVDASHCFSGTDEGWAPLNYTELYNPPSMEEILSRKQKCFSNSIDAKFASQLFVNPQLSFPSDVSEIDPMWATWGHSTCTAVNIGAIDPPRALGKATALAPQITQPALPDVQSPSAMPAASVPVPNPTATSAPAVDPGKAAPSPANPGNNNNNNDNSNKPTTPQPQPNQPINDPVSSAAPANNQGPSQPGAVSPAPATDPQQNSIIDPNSVAPAQMSQLEQALAPNSSPVVQPPANGGNNGGNGGLTVNLAPVPITLNPEQPSAQPQQPQPPVQNQGTVQGQGQGPVAAPVVVPSPHQIPSVSVAGQPVVKHANGNIVVGGATIPVGAQTQMYGHTISNGISAVVMDGTTHVISQPTPTADPILSNNQIVKVQSGGLQVGDQTLIPGSLVTISGHVIDYAGTSLVVVDGTSHTLSPVSTPNPLVINDQTMNRASNGGMLIAGQTIQPGGQTTVVGHVYSLAGSSSIMVDGTTYSLPPTSDAFLVQTIPPPTPATISGPTYSAAVPLPTASPPNPAVITLAGQTFTASPTGFVINGTTVSPGGTAVTIANTPVSLGASSHLQIGNSTLTLGSAPPTGTTPGLGGAIMSGFGSGLSPSTPATFTGAAERREFALAGGRAMMIGAGLGAMLYW